MTHISETTLRSLVKSLTWRILGSSGASFSIYVLTGNINLVMMGFGLVTIVNLILYIVHERIWSQISWGYKNNDKTSGC